MLKYTNKQTVHSVEKREILCHWKEISSKQLFSNFFSKTIVFTKFLRKKCEIEFLQLKKKKKKLVNLKF